VRAAVKTNPTMRLRTLSAQKGFGYSLSHELKPEPRVDEVIAQIGNWNANGEIP